MDATKNMTAIANECVFLPLTDKCFHFGIVKLMSTNQAAWNGHASYHYTESVNKKLTQRYVQIGVCTKCFHGGPAGYTCKICDPSGLSTENKFKLILDKRNELINPLKIITVAGTKLWADLRYEKFEAAFFPKNPKQPAIDNNLWQEWDDMLDMEMKNNAATKDCTSRDTKKRKRLENNS